MSGMRMTVVTEQLLQDGGAPEYVCYTEHGGVVLFIWAKGMAAKGIHKEILPMYGEHCLSRQTVRNLVQNFSEGRASIENEHRVGRPVEIATPAKNFTPRVSSD
jgi:hypothetical protein